ncbi:MAG: hypothetical protein KDB14_33955 [Planctomycetales bacterium]|nr:hypothetical protein [Planctomycetales bacterium]
MQRQLLPTPKLSPNSVVLEAVQVRFSGEQDEQVEAIWREVEEIPDVETRRRLEWNGFWCGVVGTQLPPALREQLDRPQSLLPDERGNAPTQGTRLQCRRGARKSWSCQQMQDELNVLLCEEEGTLRGRTYQQARCLLAIRCFPEGDGSVRVQVMPEIEHGETKPRHFGDGGLWQVRVGQEREVFERLAAELEISPGETLIVSCTPERKGLGGRFFGVDEGRSLLLLRLVQTQMDNLFAPEESGQAISAGH